MSRPALRWPGSATDTLYTSGQSIGQPTKVDPGSAARAQGILPGRVAAAHENYKAYSIEQLAKYLDGIEIANWSAPVDTHCQSTGSIDDPCDVVSSSGTLQNFVCSGPFVDASEMGRTWLAASVPATPPNFGWLAEISGFVLALGLGGGTSKATIFNGSAWSAYVSFSGTTIVQGSIGRNGNHGVNGKFGVGGATFSATYTPAIWTIPAAATPVITAASGITVPSGYQTASPNGPDMFANKLDSAGAWVMTMALASASGGATTPAYWTTTDGTNWTLRRITSPTVVNVTNLVWEPTYGFTISDALGNLISSSDGINWSTRVVSVGAFDHRKNTLAVSETGGTWLCVKDTVSGLTGHCYASLDQGATWLPIVESFDDVTGSAHKIVRVRRAGNRWAMICAANQSGNFHHLVAFSMILRS